MKKQKISIKLLLNDKIVGEANFINILKKDKLKHVFFYELSLHNALYIEKNNNIELEIWIGDSLHTNLTLLSIKDIEIAKDMVSFDSLFQGNTLLYKQDVLDIIKLWNEEENPKNWYRLTKKRKRTWLVSCLYWTGFGEKHQLNDKITIDGSAVKDVEGFYCHLGESFFGFRGYLGQDLDGLDDCVKMLNLSKTEQRVIEIFNINQLKNVLNNKRKDNLAIVLGIFEERNFILSVKS